MKNQSNPIQTSFLVLLLIISTLCLLMMFFQILQNDVIDLFFAIAFMVPVFASVAMCIYILINKK